MIINCVVPVQGVPFITSTRCTKTINLIFRSPTKLVLEMDTKTHDAPYSDTFSCKELWIVISNSGSEPKSLLMKKLKIAFVKYTMFKSKIEGRASEGIMETNATWLKYVLDNGNTMKKTENMVKKKSEKI